MHIFATLVAENTQSFIPSRTITCVLKPVSTPNGGGNHNKTGALRAPGMPLSD